MSSTERFLFVHIMKTGGTSLVRPLRRNFERREFYPDHDLDITTGGEFRHFELAHVLGVPEERRREIRVYAGHFPFLVGELLGGGFTTITVLRDPVDRTISMLGQLRRDPDPRSLDEIYDDPLYFPTLLHNHQTKIFSMSAADQPASFMDPIRVDATRLARAKANLATVDVVGVTERFDDVVTALTDRFGWRLRRDLHANATTTEDVAPASKALRRRIADDNAIDMEFYDYAKDLVRDRGYTP